MNLFRRRTAPNIPATSAGPSSGVSNIQSFCDKPVELAVILQRAGSFGYMLRTVNHDGNLTLLLPLELQHRSLVDRWERIECPITTNGYLGVDFRDKDKQRTAAGRRSPVGKLIRPLERLSWLTASWGGRSAVRLWAWEWR